jgi:hypothetical protein
MWLDVMLGGINKQPQGGISISMGIFYDFLFKRFVPFPVPNIDFARLI